MVSIVELWDLLLDSLSLVIGFIRTPSVNGVLKWRPTLPTPPTPDHRHFWLEAFKNGGLRCEVVAGEGLEPPTPGL